MNSGARFQSTLPVWGATRPSAPLDLRPCISIHAPRVGSDHAGAAPPPWHRNFNPRSPCGERPVAAIWIRRSGVFQSTLPVWGATRRSPRRWCRSSYFNPRSPCGERQVCYRYTYGDLHISIHAPRVGSDPCCSGRIRGRTHFNPRSPCGERRNIGVVESTPQQISIHAPRVGSDCRELSGGVLDVGFQSTLPVWGATGAAGCRRSSRAFQSTLPVWGATIIKVLKSSVF